MTYLEWGWREPVAGFSRRMRPTVRKGSLQPLQQSWNAPAAHKDDTRGVMLSVQAGSGWRNVGRGRQNTSGRWEVEAGGGSWFARLKAPQNRRDRTRERRTSEGGEAAVAAGDQWQQGSGGGSSCDLLSAVPAASMGVDFGYIPGAISSPGWWAFKRSTFQRSWICCKSDILNRQSHIATLHAASCPTRRRIDILAPTTRGAAARHSRQVLNNTNHPSLLIHSLACLAYATSRLCRLLSLAVHTLAHPECCHHRRGSKTYSPPANIPYAATVTKQRRFNSDFQPTSNIPAGDADSHCKTILKRRRCPAPPQPPESGISYRLSHGCSVCMPYILRLAPATTPRLLPAYLTALHHYPYQPPGDTTASRHLGTTGRPRKGPQDDHSILPTPAGTQYGFHTTPSDPTLPAPVRHLPFSRSDRRTNNRHPKAHPLAPRPPCVASNPPTPLASVEWGQQRAPLPCGAALRMHFRFPFHQSARSHNRQGPCSSTATRPPLCKRMNEPAGDSACASAQTGRLFASVSEWPGAASRMECHCSPKGSAERKEDWGRNTVTNA
ncbi:hypothetical protein BD779DRAFT_1473469 [Infundibulicybe gibba]|nr:hypothetical protein BD779DRAFT_1473469 [Infundibulicybe gibba]